MAVVVGLGGCNPAVHAKSRPVVNGPAAAEFCRCVAQPISPTSFILLRNLQDTPTCQRRHSRGHPWHYVVTHRSNSGFDVQPREFSSPACSRPKKVALPRRATLRGVRGQPGTPPDEVTWPAGGCPADDSPLQSVGLRTGCRCPRGGAGRSAFVLCPVAKTQPRGAVRWR